MSDNPGTTPAAPPASKQPPRRPDQAHPQGFVVTFGKDNSRMARVATRAGALENAKSQRGRGELVRIWEGTDWLGGKNPIREGATPLLEVAEGAALPE